jgi:hypothetical protein
MVDNCDEVRRPVFKPPVIELPEDSNFLILWFLWDDLEPSDRDLLAKEATRIADCRLACEPPIVRKRASDTGRNDDLGTTLATSPRTTRTVCPRSQT